MQIARLPVNFRAFYLVSRGQTTISAQGVIAQLRLRNHVNLFTPQDVDGVLRRKGYWKCARPFSARALILQAITPCAEIVVWPRETTFYCH